jgi:hypothetical protein
VENVEITSFFTSQGAKGAFTEAGSIDLMFACGEKRQDTISEFVLNQIFFNTKRR